MRLVLDDGGEAVDGGLCVETVWTVELVDVGDCVDGGDEVADGFGIHGCKFHISQVLAPGQPVMCTQRPAEKR